MLRLRLLPALAAVALSAGGCDDRTPTVSECYPSADACGDIQLEAQVLLFSAVGGDREQGQALYAQHCASCHGLDGKGTGPAAVIDMTNPSWQANYTDNRIRATVLSGRGMRMPAIALPDDPLRDLISYVRTLERDPSAPAASPY
jgi:mono/diheme cytochrome c family protein